MERAGSQEFEDETEKKGLGTPATRASIIEKLVSSGYAKRSGKQIIPTVEGKELIGVLPEYLKSASMTAEWENRLLLMEKGMTGSNAFMSDRRTNFARDISAQIREVYGERVHIFENCIPLSVKAAETTAEGKDKAVGFFPDIFRYGTNPIPLNRYFVIGFLHKPVNRFLPFHQHSQRRCLDTPYGKTLIIFCSKRSGCVHTDQPVRFRPAYGGFT